MYVNKVVVVSNLPLSEPVSRNRILPFLKLLVTEGSNVTFICPKGDVGNYALPSSVILLEVSLDTVKPRSFVRRALKEARDVAILLKKARSEHANAYLVTIPSMFLAFLSPIYLFRKTVFLDVRDLTWEYLSDTSFVHKVSKKAFRFLFDRTINFYHLVSVTNATELLYVQRRWRRAQEPLLVANGIGSEQFNMLEGVRPSSSEQFTITYVGNIGIAQDLCTFVEAAQALPDIQFKIVGTGIEHNKIAEIVVCSGISNVELVGKVPWENLKEHYNATHVLYAQLTPDFSGAMPSKLYEYLSTGKYIIYGGQKQAVDILSEFHNNEVIPPCDVSALVEAIKKAVDYQKTNTICVQNRLLIKNQYIRENTAKKLSSAIKKATQNSQS